LLRLRYASQISSPKLCTHKECSKCMKMSVPNRTSDWYVCHKCYDLHRRE
jgi:hypothetical protein